MATRIIKIILLLVIIAVAIYFRFVNEIDVNLQWKKIIRTSLSLIILLLSFRVVIYIIAVWYRIDKKTGKGRIKENLIVGLSNLFSIASVIAIIFAILSLFGLNPAEVFTSLSIVAAALAIITKDFIIEIIVGIYNGFSSKIEIDDYVKIGHHKGKIIDFGLQKVALLSDGDDIVYIPNLKFYQEEIINYTKSDIRQMSIEFSIDPNFVKNLNKINDLLNDRLSKDSRLEKFELKPIELKKDSLSFELDYYISKNVELDHVTIRKDVLKIIYQTIYGG
ncbi:MAG: hypothetical protein RLZZ546_2180 [Bacteroidota bacterium]|jgi:small-conductance mechanosensitive channel